VSFVLFTIIFGVAGAASIYFFNQGVRDAKLLVREEVDRQLQIAIASEIKQDIDNLKQIIDREKIISEIVIDYFIPSQQAISSSNRPQEYEILNNRGFKSVIFLDAAQRVKFSGDVIVLDLVNQPLITDAEKQNKSESDIANLLEQKVADFLNKIVNRIPNKSVLVVYIRPGRQRINAIDNELSQKIPFYSVANTPVSLIGAVIDSGYVAYGL
jgi:hypothetical protein